MTDTDVTLLPNFNNIDLARSHVMILTMVMAKADEAESEGDKAEISFLQKLCASRLPISRREFSENKLYHFQEKKDEVTDDELRLWMLLVYACPCKALSAEDNVCVTQENFLRNTREKGDCEDIELHYQEDVRENRRVLSCHIHRAAEHMFFERCEVVSAHDGGNGFPSYVTALITAQIDRKLIYISKMCADMLRKQKWPAFFTHEAAGQVYKWKPVFAGLRSWCWKRREEE